MGTGNQVLGDRRQRIEPNTQSLKQKERADLLSGSTLHRTWEQANSEQRLTSGTGGFYSYRADIPGQFWRSFIAQVQVVVLL